MTTSNRHEQFENVKSRGDGAPADEELSSSSPSKAPDQGSTAGIPPADAPSNGTPPDTSAPSEAEERWRMPSGTSSVDPCGYHKLEIERQFNRANEAVGERWKPDADQLHDYMAACQSPAEKLFLTDLLEKAGTLLENVSTDCSRVDGWYLTISAPFHVRRKLGCDPCFRVYPQRPILMPNDLRDLRDTRRSRDDSPYCRVDFLAVIHESPNTERGGSPRPMVVEIDGKGNHSSGQDIRKDYTRGQKFQRMGVPVCRYLASDVNDSRYDTGARLFSNVWAEARKMVDRIE